MPTVAAPATDPGRAHECFVRGRRLMRSFDIEGYEAATVELIQAVQADPSSAAAYAALAETYSYWGFRRELNGEEHESFYALALDSAGKALARAPKSAQAHRAMAVALRRGAAGDPERRKDEALAALDLDPNDAENWCEKWRAFGYDPDDASIRRTLELDPELCSAHIDLGVAYCEADRLAEALTEMVCALKINPRNSLVHYDLAMVVYRQGHRRAARELLARALKARPNDPLLKAGELLLRGDSHDAA
ncbi:MAG TPA: hypothetical protein DCM05_17230 [Elusimicrobia bacterium]|nr:hypothetical protein [Elusimicrobiota bacterium]